MQPCPHLSYNLDFRVEDSNISFLLLLHELKGLIVLVNFSLPRELLSHWPRKALKTRDSKTEIKPLGGGTVICPRGTPSWVSGLTSQLHSWFQTSANTHLQKQQLMVLMDRSVGNLDLATGFQRQPGSAPVTVSIWRLNQLMEAPPPTSQNKQK